MPQIDPRSAASRSAPSPLTAALVILVALAFPAPLITWWNALPLHVPVVSALLTAYYLAQVIVLSTFLAGWCLPRSPLTIRLGIVTAGTAITVLALTRPSLITYGLYYATSSTICTMLAVQHLGRTPLWPPRFRDLRLTLVPLPLILASGAGVAALAWAWGIPRPSGTAQQSAPSLMGTVAHIDTYPELLIRSLWTGIGEEVAAVLLVIGLTRRNAPIALVYLIPAVVRASYHAHFSWAAAGLIILGVSMVFLWRRHERLLPLIAAHTLWDATARDHTQLLLGLTAAGALILVGVGVLKAGRRMLRRHRFRPATPLADPAAQVAPADAAERTGPGTPAPPTGTVTS